LLPRYSIPSQLLKRQSWNDRIFQLLHPDFKKMRSEVNKIRLTVLIALLFSTLCAGVFRTPPILFMASLLLSTPFVGFLLSRWSSRSLRLTRTLPASGMAGEVLNGEIMVSNSARLPAFLVHACADASALSVGQSGASIEPLGCEHVAPLLRGRTQTSWQQQWFLRRRGVHLLESAGAGALDPLGLNRHLPVRSEPLSIVVLPRLLKLERLGFFGGDGFEQHAPHHSIAVADAMDFHGVRLWQPGEAIRRAHWKYTARTGQLHVIEWEETPTIDLAILLDTDAAALVGDADDNTLEASITAAASISAYLLENGCRVELFFFAPPLTTAGSGQGAAEEKPASAPSDTRAVRVSRHAAHSVKGQEDILRALAEIEPITARGGDLKSLFEAALPLVSSGLSVLMIASSRAPVESVLAHAGGARGPRIHAFVIDADSFEVGTARDAAAPPSDIASALTARGVYHWRRGQSLAAALEGAA
jgi:uncharacterized protein (DUF58 family)